MSGDLIFVCFAATLLGVRLFQRSKIDRAIRHSVVFDTTPINFNGSKRRCLEAEAIALAHGWRKTTEARWQIFWRMVRFVPAGEGAATPQQVLSAFDRPTKISKIELPGSSKPKDS